MLNSSQGDACLYSQKTRKNLIVVSIFLFAAGLFALPLIPENSIKILLLYFLIICMMHLIIAYKNYLNKYEMGIFIFLCIQLVSVAPGFGEMDFLVAASYLLSYRYGASSRSFMGTVIDVLSGGGFVSKHFVWHFIFSSLVFLSFLVSVYLAYIIKKSSGEVKKFAGFLTLVYIACFTAPSAYFISANFGRVELFAFIFMMALLAVIERPGLRWLIPLLALFTMAIHLILVFFYIPFIVMMLLYVLLANKTGRKERVFLLTVTVVLVIAAFLVYFLFHEQTFIFQDANEFSEYLRAKSDLVFNDGDIHMTLYAKLQDHLAGWRNSVGSTGLGYSGNMSIVINIPLIVLFVFFWVRCFRQEKDLPIKLFFLLPVFVLVYHAAAFFLFYDFGRWMIMILNIQFMLVLYLIHAKNGTVLLVINKMIPCIEKNRFIIVLICVLMAFLGPVTQVGPSEKFGHIEKGLMLLLGRF